MVDPVRVAGQAAVRFQIQEGSSPDRAAIQSMLTMARLTFSAGAALSRFEFRLKEESGGQKYLELRKQTRFGAFREALGNRTEARARERQGAMEVLESAYGRDFLAQVVNNLGQSAVNKVQARQAVTGTQELARRSEHLLNQLREAGFDSLDKARSFVESKCNFALSIDRSLENSINHYGASALPLAVYERPELLDTALPIEERAEIFAAYEKRHLDQLIETLKNAPRNQVDSPEEHRNNTELAIQGVTLGAPIAHDSDMACLTNPEDISQMRDLFVRGKEMGLRLQDIVGVARTNHVRLGLHKADQLQATLNLAFSSQPISADELKLLKSFFGLRQ